MSFDRKWVEAQAQCPDGMAWGLDYVKDGGKDLPSALKGFTRADFLLWFMVKSGTLPVESAFDLLLDLAKIRLNAPSPFLALLNHASKVELCRARGESAAEAETLMTVGKYQQGHASTVIAFLARMRLQIISSDFDEALKDGQCVINNLVAARTGSLNFAKPDAVQEHKGLCSWLNSCVVVAGRRI